LRLLGIADILLGRWLLRFSLPPFAEFVIVIRATAVGCWLFYDVGRRIGWLRPCIGFRAETEAPRPPARAARAEA